MKQKKHPGFAANEAIIANAVKFNVFIRWGNKAKEAHGVWGLTDMNVAHSTARDLNEKYGSFGRRALIYALDAHGRAAVCPY